jgi:hypothetical protein
MNQTGIKVVIGVPTEIKPLANAPEGQGRFRFRPGSVATVVIRKNVRARQYVLTDLGDKWGLLAQGMNLRTEGLAKAGVVKVRTRYE